MEQDQPQPDFDQLKDLVEQNQQALDELRRMLENMEILLAALQQPNDPRAKEMGEGPEGESLPRSE